MRRATCGPTGARGFLAAFVAAALLVGCATRPPVGVPPEARIRVELEEVPFFPQPRGLCGPASLATALGAAGIAAPFERLVEQVYLPGRAGSLQAEMLAAARRNGAVAVVIPPRLDALLAQLGAGLPVIVLQGLRVGPRWHYAVAVGYDPGRDEILLRSGEDARLALSLADFDRTWSRSGRGAMVALPPGRLAPGVDESTTVAALVAFERVADPSRARSAYEAALARWPGNFTLHMGRGNTAYAAGDFVSATEAYRRAIHARPRAVSAYNNLALALVRLGRYGEARRTAARALMLGSSWRAPVLDTLRRIEAAQHASE